MYDHLERGIYNRIAPLTQTRIANLRTVKYGMTVRPRTDELDDFEKANISTRLLRYTQDVIDFNGLIDEEGLREIERKANDAIYRNIETVILYPTREELALWFEKSGLPLKKFFNTSGLQYKALNLKEKLPTMTEEEQLQLLASDGMLVKRPILVTEDAVLVGFKEKDWEKLLQK